MKLLFITGAGVSEESGIPTFREGSSDPLWENYDVTKVATLDGWRKDKKYVTDFYNKLRTQLCKYKPNTAHNIISELEETHDVTIITQNVDDLHERSGSKNVYKLHGDLRKVRSVVNPDEIYDWGYKEVDIENDRAKNNARLRPHVVWFGEYPDQTAYKKAYESIDEADMIIFIGTSFQIIYLEDMLVKAINSKADVHMIDPNPIDVNPSDVDIFEGKASDGMTYIKNILNGK
jgi:NAD-dependent deacetylase